MYKVQAMRLALFGKKGKSYYEYCITSAGDSGKYWKYRTDLRGNGDVFTFDRAFRI